MKSFQLGNDRSISVKKNQGQLVVVIKQKDSDEKFVEFTPNRWAQFRQSMEEIQTNVNAALVEGKDTKYRNHIGGGVHVSVTTGYRCVDFRKFYVPYGQSEVRPTRKGIALRLSEWEQMKAVVDSINTAYPPLGTALPCYLQDDHQNQLGALQCSECYPFVNFPHA